MSYKKYPKYKDSGVEWIGEIPAGWEIILYKRVINSIKDGTHGTYKRVQNGYPLLSAKNVFNHGLIINENESMITYEDYLEITKNNFPRKLDLLITCVGTIGRTFVYNRNEPLAFQRSVVFLRFKSIAYTYFFKYFVESNIYFNQLTSLAKTSAQSGIYMNDILNTTIILPPLPEQKQIAAFLDKKTARIDTLIEKKKQMINLLKEERTAMINRAVTKGLDLSAPMKDSGIQWLGKIPEHWEVKRLKYVVRSKLMYGANESAELDDTNYPRYIRITDFDENGKLRDDTFKSLLPDIANDYLLNDGDILFARSGATVGKTFQYKGYKGIACFAGYLIKAEPDIKKITSNFLYNITRSNIYDNWKNSIFIQATIQNIGANKYNNFILSIPPLPEQKQIVTYIEKETKRIDTIITKCEKEIELLNEYRTALISEAVTGKIDVREAPPAR